MREPCPKCGQLTHPKGCPKRKRSGKHKPREIVAFDCETVAGVGIVLFLCSGKSQAPSYLYNPSGLTLAPILDWLISTGRGKLSMGFYFDYDVNQLVAMLPPIHQAHLAAAGKVYYKGYRIRHVPSKRFSVSNAAGESVTIWDCSGWAQCSFAKLCDDWKLGTESERETVRAMKARRGDFSTATERELVEYTTLECALLSDWVERLIELHESCDIHLRSYTGPGSTAGAMIRQRGWKPPSLPERVERIAEEAFFGGRSEISSIGPVAGPVYSYDVNSAYPTAIATLPELADARWFRTRSHRAGAWGFYRVRWKQKPSAVWGLFPVRGAMLPTGKKSVSLLYPTTGEGWFHSYEVETALELAPAAVEVVDGWVIEPKRAPFGWIQEVAAERLRYKAAGDAKAFPLKVGLNSIYGKLAQHSGSHPLQCLAYAGAVTAHTRSLLLRQAYQSGHSVLLLATDGILSTAPLPVEVGAGLGQWELAVYDSAWLLQAGVYWAGSKKRTRGIDARGLHLEQVETVWKRAGTRGVIELEARRVLSYRLCNAQNKLHLTGTWSDSTRKVRFSPEPRRRSYRWQGERLLTIPARVETYRAQALADQLAIEITPGSAYDEFEALPEWAQPD